MRDNNINLTGGHFLNLYRQPIIGIRNDKNFPNTSFLRQPYLSPLLPRAFFKRY